MSKIITGVNFQAEAERQETAQRFTELEKEKIKFAFDENSTDSWKVEISKMMAAVEEWKNAGISTVVEDPENMIYVYKDDIQYVTVGASKNTEGYHVYIKFTEVKHEERR